MAVHTFYKYFVGFVPMYLGVAGTCIDRSRGVPQGNEHFLLNDLLRDDGESSFILRVSQVQKACPGPRLWMFQGIDRNRGGKGHPGESSPNNHGGEVCNSKGLNQTVKFNDTVELLMYTNGYRFYVEMAETPWARRGRCRKGHAAEGLTCGMRPGNMVEALKYMNVSELGAKITKEAVNPDKEHETDNMVEVLKYLQVSQLFAEITEGAVNPKEEHEAFCYLREFTQSYMTVTYRTGEQEEQRTKQGCGEPDCWDRELTETDEEEVVLMQKKGGRSRSPRRRRRDRADRERERTRQERRAAWTVRSPRDRVVTETCSRRPLTAPWTRGHGRPTEAARPSRPTTAPSSSSARPSVPDIPPLGNESVNVVWWSEVLGLQDAMQDNNRVLPEETVEAVVDNLRSMEPARRMAMVSELLPFLGIFLAEILRAVNLSQQPPEEVEIIEEDSGALIQTSLQQHGSAQDSDIGCLMQKFDPSIPFGSKLAQLQGHLNGFDDVQCKQAAWHLHVMIRRLRQLAGTTSAKVNDRFERLEALVASYMTAETEVPLSMQIWSESQLRPLVPYLNGGRTPESGASETPLPSAAMHPASTAASSTDTVEVVNSSEAVVEPEYSVRDTDGNWVAASAEEAAEFREHDRQVREELHRQEEADRAAYAVFESSQAQRWDDWAVSSEMNRPSQPPSRKRIKITVCAGTNGGKELGEAIIEGVIDHDQTAVVSFSTEETILGGVESVEGMAVNRDPNYVSAQACPQLAQFERDHLPGLPENVVDFMTTVEGRHWLWQFSVGAVSEDMIVARFGVEIAEAFQLWVALQADEDRTIRNVGDIPMHEHTGTASSSNASTVEVGNMPGDVVVEDGSMGGTGDGGGADDQDADEHALTQLDGADTCLAHPGAGLGQATTLEGMATGAEVGSRTDDAVGTTAVGDSGTADERKEGCDEDDRERPEPHPAGHDGEVRRAGNELAPHGDAVTEGGMTLERVLQVWNEDRSVGVGLEDSMLSVGNFEHEQGPGDQLEVVTSGVPALSHVASASSGSAAEGSDAPGTSSGSAATEGMSRSVTVGLERKSPTKSGQASIKGWLQK